MKVIKRESFYSVLVKCMSSLEESVVSTVMQWIIYLLFDIIVYLNPEAVHKPSYRIFEFYTAVYESNIFKLIRRLKLTAWKRNKMNAFFFANEINQMLMLSIINCSKDFKTGVPYRKITLIRYQNILTSY